MSPLPSPAADTKGSHLRPCSSHQEASGPHDATQTGYTSSHDHTWHTTWASLLQDSSMFVHYCMFIDGMFYRHIEWGLSSCSVWPKLGIRSAPFPPSLQVSCKICKASSSFTKVVTSSISRRSTSPGWMVQLIPSACQCGGMLGFEDLSNSGNLELRHGDEHALPARTSSWFHKFHVAIWYCRVLISYRLYGSPIGTTRLDGTALGSLVLKIWNERCDDFCFTSTPSGTCSRILPAQQMVLQPHPEQSDLRRSLDAIRVLERSFGKNVFIAADNKFFVSSFTIFIWFHHAYLHVYHADCLRPISAISFKASTASF